MFQNLNIFKASHAMAVHAAQQQAEVARNLANADTPGYVAQPTSSFRSQYEDGVAQIGLRATRKGHVATGDFHSNNFERERMASSSPNGNSVSLEQELLKAVEIKREHDRAIAIYKSAMGVLRTSLGRR